METVPCGFAEGGGIIERRLIQKTRGLQIGSEGGLAEDLRLCLVLLEEVSFGNYVFIAC